MFKNVYSYRVLDDKNSLPAREPLCGYGYIIAANGVFVESENERVKARVIVSPGDIRGLELAQESLVLKNGYIPKELLQEIIAVSRNVAEEMFFQIIWDGAAYKIIVPQQETTAVSVKYTGAASSGVVCEIHTPRHRGVFLFDGQ